MIFSLLLAGSDRDANLVLEDGTENSPRELSAITVVGGVKNSNRNELDSIGDKVDSIDNDSDSIDDKIDSYYVDDNLADGASVDRKRIDRSDSLDVVPTTMRGIPLADLLRSTVTRGFYVTKTGSPEQGRNVILTDSTESPTTLIVRDDVRTTSVTDTTVTNLESSNTFTTSTLRETVTATSNSVGTTLAEFNTTESSTNPASVDPSIDESSTNPTSVDSWTEKSSTNPTSVDPSIEKSSTNPTSVDPSIEKSSTNPASVDLLIQSSSPTESPISTEAIATNVPEEVTETPYTESESTTVSKTKKTDEKTSTSTTTASTADRSRRREKLGFEFGEKSSQRSRFKNGGEPSVKRTESRQTPRRRVIVGRRRRPISTTPAINYSVVADAKTTAKPIREETEIGESTLSSIDAVTNESTGNRESLNEGGTDRFEAEVNSSRNTSAQSPGSLLSTRLRKPVPTQQQSKSSNTFSNHRKSRPTGGDHSSESGKHDAVDKTTEATKLEKDIDQSSRAQEIAVTLADPPPSQSSSTGRPALRNAFRRKISTTIAPRSDATTTTTSSTTTTTSRSTLRFTRVHKDRQKTRSQEKPVQNATTRPRRPQVIDYDYYEDEEESVIGKSTLNGKLFLTSKGSIRCLDQGNFPHPYSCRKFITCARMVNGMVVGAEYTCPDKLSYDPVGGICNWSAGLGCKD